MGICNIHLRNGNGNAQILTGETTSPGAKDAIVKTLGKHFNNLTDSIIILPDTSVNKKYMGLATLSVINIRKHPQQSAELVSQALLGTPVRILKSENYWYLVQTPDNYLGWVEESSLVPLDMTDLKKWKQSDRVIVMINSGWIYSAPDEKETVGDVVAGCILVRAGEERGFTRVCFPDGRTGYIESNSATDFAKWKAGTSVSGESIVKMCFNVHGIALFMGRFQHQRS